MSKIADIQTILEVKPDGVWGPKSQAALDAAIAGRERPAVFIGEPVDARSEKAIQTLHASVQPLARSLLRDAFANNIVIVVTSATRTYPEQDALYEQGRSKPGKIVTNARAGHSNHNFGIAFDVTVFEGREPVWEGPQYRVVGALGKSLGLEWGGDWTSINDEPHFELHPAWAAGMSESAMLAELRDRHAVGRDAFA